MRIKCIDTVLTTDQMKALNAKGEHDYSACFTIGREYTVLGLTYINDPEKWTTMLFELCDDNKNMTSIPSCLFEIVDHRPSVFWQARHNFPNFTLWPIEFYRDFFHDDLRERRPGLKRVFDIVVDRLTHEFKE